MSAAAGEGNGEGDAQLLVSEFPPPPFYYTEVANLRPPDIPKEALERGTRRAAAAAARAREAAERLRLADDSTNTDAILGGVRADEKEEEGEVIGVFGEVVEVGFAVMSVSALFSCSP
jgi:mediator of RNA polymerase II transcription subunit 7